MQLRVIFSESAPEQDLGCAPLPTLGEIIDRIAENEPGFVLGYDPTWRDRRVLRVEIVERPD